MKTSVNVRQEINTYEDVGYVKLIRVDRPTIFSMTVTKYEYTNGVYVSKDLYSVRIGNQVTYDMEDFDMTTTTPESCNIQKLTNNNPNNIFFIKIDTDGVYICTKKGGRYTIDIIETFYRSSISITFLNNISEDDRLVELTSDCIKETILYKQFEIINSKNVIKFIGNNKTVYEFINIDRFIIPSNSALHLRFPINNRIINLNFSVSLGMGNNSDYILSGEFAGDRTNPFVGYFYGLNNSPKKVKVYSIIDASYANIDLYITSVSTYTVNCIINNLSIINKNITTELIDNFNSNDYVEIPYTYSSGTTEMRPTNIRNGFEYFDTTLNKPIWWNDKSWVDATGTTV